MRSKTRFMLALLVILMIGLPLALAADFKSVEIKVYNVNTNKVYLDKIIPKDQPYHVILNNIEGDTYDITYDPSKSGVHNSLSCRGGPCTVTIVGGVSDGYKKSFSNGPIKVEFIPTNKSPGGSTKAPIPLGSIFFIGIVLVMLLIRRTGHEM